MIWGKYNHPVVILVAFFLLPGYAQVSTAATIDDFSTPQARSPTGAASAVSGPGIIGGSRQAGGGGFFHVDGGVATFSFSFLTGGNLMGLTYDGTEAVDTSTFSPVDLTDGGAATHFLLGITEIDGALSIAMGVTDVDGQTTSSIFSAMTAPGLYTILLPNGPADLTRIDLVSATLFLSPGSSSGGSVSIDFLCTGTPEGGCTETEPATAMPEPAADTLYVLAVAMLVLMACRKSATLPV